ncbi:Uncharacterised protein [Yersinia rohdei]|nr:Uncharacterised protein [Yersinia rohdei]
MGEVNTYLQMQHRYQLTGRDFEIKPSKWISQKLQPALMFLLMAICFFISGVAWS